MTGWLAMCCCITGANKATDARALLQVLADGAAAERRRQAGWGRWEGAQPTWLGEASSAASTAAMMRGRTDPRRAVVFLALELGCHTVQVDAKTGKVKAVSDNLIPPFIPVRSRRSSRRSSLSQPGPLTHSKSDRVLP